MEFTESASSISDTISDTISDALPSPPMEHRWRGVAGEASPAPEWKLADNNDVTIASRYCVETLIAQQLELPLNAPFINRYEKAEEPNCDEDRASNRFTFTQLYSQQKVVVDLHLFDPTDRRELAQLQQHAKVLQALDYAAIPTYIDAFELETPIGPGFAIVQMASEARSIQAWMNDGYCFDEFELRLIALRVLSALNYLHDQADSQTSSPIDGQINNQINNQINSGAAAGGTLHRAIKPSNILLENRRVADPFTDYEPTRDRRTQKNRDRGFGRLYLVNLGIAPVESTSGTVTVEGTYGYTAPEQFYGRAQPASDLYSLGATLIYMASGKSPSTWMSADLEIQPHNVALSRPFVEWISRLTQADLTKRTTSASTALQELELIQLLGKPLAKGDYTLAIPRTQLSPQPQMAYLDFKVNSTPQELKVQFNYDRIRGDKTQGRAASTGIVSSEELQTALLLVLAITIIGGTVALTGSPFLGFVVALLLPGFYFLVVPYAPMVDDFEDRQASIRLRRDNTGRMFVTLATTPLPKHRRKGRAKAQAAFLESQIHFANVPIRLLCTKSGFFSPKISFVLATNDPKRTQRLSIVGDQEEIRWLRVHVGRWIKS